MDNNTKIETPTMWVKQNDFEFISISFQLWSYQYMT